MERNKATGYLVTVKAEWFDRQAATYGSSRVSGKKRFPPIIIDKWKSVIRVCLLKQSVLCKVFVSESAAKTIPFIAVVVFHLYEGLTITRGLDLDAYALPLLGERVVFCL